MTPTPLEAARETCRKIADNIAKVMPGAGIPNAIKKRLAARKQPGHCL